MTDAWNAPMLGFINMPGGWEWLLILLIALLLFGRRLPEVARSMGKSIVEFKKGMQDVQRDIESEPPTTPADERPPALADKTRQDDTKKT